MLKDQVFFVNLHSFLQEQIHKRGIEQKIIKTSLTVLIVKNL